MCSHIFRKIQASGPVEIVPIQHMGHNTSALYYNYKLQSYIYKEQKTPTCPFAHAPHFCSTYTCRDRIEIHFYHLQNFNLNEKPIPFFSLEEDNNMTR